MKKKILVVYASAGGGHYSAAKSIEKAINERYPDYEVVLADGPKLSGSKVINFLNDIYDIFLKTNIKYAIWGFGVLNFLDGDKSIVRFFPNIVKRVSKYFSDVNPDIIVSTNSSVNAFISEFYKELGWKGKKPFIIFVTDPTTGFVKAWVHSEVDLMIASLPESKQQLIEYGMNPDKIRIVNGIVVNPDFNNVVKTKEEAREEIGLEKDKFTVLATSGGVGTKDLGKFVREIGLSKFDLQLVVCCGRNQELEKELLEFSKSAYIKMKVIGFTDKMHTLMDAADIIIGKPGPAIIAEATLKLRPLILEGLNGVMHQERGNLKYAVDKGIALKADTKEEIIQNIKLLMTDKNKYNQMVESMKLIDHSKAAYNLADMIINYSTKEFKPKDLAEKSL